MRVNKAMVRFNNFSDIVESAFFVPNSQIQRKLKDTFASNSRIRPIYYKEEEEVDEEIEYRSEESGSEELLTSTEG